VLLAILGFGITVARGAADPAGIRPTQRTLDCTASNCHATETRSKFVHNPVSKGSCESCHVYVDEKKHTFQLRRQGGELCTFCHIGGGGAVGAIAHQPFERGECLSCHNPHGGSTRVILRADDPAKLCTSCHGDITRGRKHLHGPVSTGSCLACHAAHRSTFPKLLAAEGRDLCLSCHDQMKTQITRVNVVHKPATGDCRQCHEVHASDHIMQLKEEPQKLCLGCHDKVKDQIAAATVKHSAVTTGDACLNCHTPHGSELSKLMKAEPIKTCLKCHDTNIASPDGRAVASMAILADPTQFRHGPVRDGDCAGCHIAHGSSEQHLLAKPYASEFYQPFSLDKYELCFSCHDKQLVLEKETTHLTGFRNGDRNLHYLHVNKEEKGRNCRACHSTHTSTQPLHIRESVPFGNWQLPIGFRKTGNGGACQSACHKEYGYDRVKPVVNNVDQP
jgi:predicted CXXCH cytochrome family protein